MAPPPRNPIRPTKPATLRNLHYQPTELCDNPERIRPQVGVHGETILPFYSSCSPFSNFYPARFCRDGHEFLSSEQYFMFRKAVTFNDANARDEILKQRNPGKCKELGRNVQNYNESVWNSARYEAMIDALYAKFSQNNDLKSILLSTGSGILVEASYHDRIWGVGMDEYDRRMKNPQLWPGENLLGKALMTVRAQLRGEAAAQKPREIDYSIPEPKPQPPQEPTSKRQLRKYKAQLESTVYPLYAVNDENRPRPTPPDVILLFTGSEWHQGWYRLYPFWWNGHRFDSLDPYINYRKALLFDDEEQQRRILAKGYGFRYPRNFDAELWLKEQDKVYFDGVYALYSQNDDLRAGLLETDEGWLVSKWGIGLPYNTTTENCPATWKGDNRYGKALMEVRAKLRAEDTTVVKTK